MYTSASIVSGEWYPLRKDFSGNGYAEIDVFALSPFLNFSPNVLLNGLGKEMISMELMTVGEVCEMLRVPASWIYARTCESNSVGETIPHLKLGKLLRFRRAEVEKWVERHHRGAERVYPQYKDEPQVIEQ